MFFDKIYDYPVCSIEWKKMKSSIEMKIKKRKEYDRYVLCIQSLISNKDDEVLGELYKKKFIPKDEIKMFNNDITFMMDKNIHLIERYKAEYDQRYIQIIVACIIYDEYNNFLVLEQNTKTKRSTLVKGHVDFNKSCYHVNELDFLKENMIREITEELDIPRGFYLDPLLEGMIYHGTKPKCMEKMGVVYSQKIPFNIIKKIKSGEPEKHRVVLASKESLKSGNYLLDDWLTYLFNQ
nr:MAG TPA: NUDIX hydrolase [Caudoviricetes sp.]